MKRVLLLASIIGLSLLSGSFVGCGAASSYGSGGPTATDDLGKATALWKSLTGYQAWSQYAGMTGFQDASQHGSYNQFYLNQAAAADLSSSGAIIVTESYDRKDPEALNGIFVMQNIAGYDKDFGNWFWAQFDLDGNVVNLGLDGAPAAGRVDSCIQCHVSTAQGADLLHINDN